MGANLCSLREPNPEQSAIADSSSGPRLEREMSLINRIRPNCLKVEKRKLMQMEVVKMAKTEKVAKVKRAKKLTLEEWRTASPAVRRNGVGISAGEIQVPRQSNNRICPWSSSPSSYVEIRPHFFLATDSFNLERPKKAEETFHEGMTAPCLRKSNSGKIKKRVSFRLPEEADIFIFYSP